MGEESPTETGDTFSPEQLMMQARQAGIDSVLAAQALILDTIKAGPGEHLRILQENFGFSPDTAFQIMKIVAKLSPLYSRLCSGDLRARMGLDLDSTDRTTRT